MKFFVEFHDFGYREVCKSEEGMAGIIIFYVNRFIRV